MEPHTPNSTSAYYKAADDIAPKVLTGSRLPIIILLCALVVLGLSLYLNDFNAALATHGFFYGFLYSWSVWLVLAAFAITGIADWVVRKREVALRNLKAQMAYQLADKPKASE